MREALRKDPWRVSESLESPSIRRVGRGGRCGPIRILFLGIRFGFQVLDILFQKVNTKNAGGYFLLFVGICKSYGSHKIRIGFVKNNKPSLEYVNKVP